MFILQYSSIIFSHIILLFPYKETGEEELVEKDGKSMIGILSLGIAKDKPFTLVLDGNDEEVYMSKFENLIENE